ncbi:kelch repeat-containing protein [Planctomycetota bacterium]
MKKTILLILFLALGLASTSPAAEDTWTYKTNMPTARVFVGGCVLDGKIYVISGAPSASSVTRAVEMYDPTVDTWTRMANMPSARCYHATCTFDGKIYVFGGTSPDMWSSAKKNVYVYDPKVDTWTQKANMPYANSGCGIAVVDGLIYLIGGALSESSPAVPTVMAYNPVTESWTQKADMPTARANLSACVLDGKIYAIGGAKEWRVASYKQMEVYDPSTNTWTRKPDMPTQRWGLGTCVVDGKIFAIGGSTLVAASTTANEVYDPITDTWTTKSPMQQKRYGLFVGSVRNKIYAIGGSVPGFLSTVEEYDTGFIVTPPLPDFNGDGIIDSVDMCMMVDYWGTDEPLYDIAPPPFGDGIVDVQDLILLAEHLFEEIFPPELIAYWKLDETEGNIADNSTSDNHGILSGNPTWKPDSGQVAGALEFDGIDNYITTDFVLDPSLGAFSVLVWWKGGVPGQVIISQSDGIGSGEIWLGMDALGGNLMTGLVPPPAGRFIPQPLVSGSIITYDQWRHIGFVWDGLYRILYVDGIEVAKDAAAQNPLKSATGGLYIGASKTLDAGTYFSGLIDDVRIYNVSLSAEEIAALAP